MAFWRGAIGAKTGQLIHYNMDSIETTGANNNLRFPEVRSFSFSAASPIETL